MKVTVINVGPVTGLCVHANHLWWSLLASQITNLLLRKQTLRIIAA